MSGAVHMWTDGSAWKGRGGFAALLVRRRSLQILAGPIGPADGSDGVTNQQAELFAAMAGLLIIPPLPGLTRPVTVYSDSAYLINCFTEDWIGRWRHNGWRTAGGDPVANRPLWESLEAVAVLHRVRWVHMRGHGRGSEDPRWVAYNARADRLATAARAERITVNRRIPRGTAVPAGRSRGGTA